jgi:KDO2-lipid IV(A) lauroyltransferase
MLPLKMDKLIYWFARALIALLQSLPLTWAARIGRGGGAIAFWIDARHRRVALKYLAMCFEKEKSPEQIRAIAKENFRRIGENYCCFIKASMMTKEQIEPHLEFTNLEQLRAWRAATPPRNVVMAIGHFGNFELYARYGQFVPGLQVVTTYRGLRQPLLNRLMQEMRELSGCLFFERRTQGAELRIMMRRSGYLLVLLVDQHSGDAGVILPFFGRLCSHSTAPAIFALRYRCALATSICYRIGLARWRIETGPEIPTRENGKARSVDAITADTVRMLEAAVRRDPANWFWVHNRWKPVKPKAESGKRKAENPAQIEAGE